MARDAYGVTRRRSSGPVAFRGNLPYDPARQVPAVEMRQAREVLARMLDGGELLASNEAPPIREVIAILDEAVAAAARRAGSQGATDDDGVTDA